MGGNVLEPGWRRRDVEEMAQALESARRDLERVRDSRAWQIGHGVTSGLRRLTMRQSITGGAVQAAIDRIEEVQRTVSMHVEAADDPPPPPRPDWDAWVGRSFAGEPPRPHLIEVAHDHRLRMRTDGLGRDLLADPDGLQLDGTALDITGDDFTLAIAPGAVVTRCSITVRGSGVRIGIGPGAQLDRNTLRVEGDGGMLLIGAESSAENGSMLAQGDGMSIVVGDGCLLMRGYVLRTSEPPVVVDMETGRPVNPPAPVAVADRAVVGLGAHIQPGVSLGTHSVVAGSAVVTDDVAANTLVAGNPATVRQAGIGWLREA